MRDGERTDVRCLGEVRPGGGPPDERTLFEIGSITKVFTATVLADMALEGVVALDQPAQELLPAGVRLPAKGRPITLADLASHVAGLPRLPRGMLMRGVLQRDDPWHGFGEEELLASLPRTRVREPGGRVRYSNLGAGLLGLLLARRAGTTYDDLVDDPRLPAARAARHADGGARRGPGPVRRGPRPPRPRGAALAHHRPAGRRRPALHARRHARRSWRARWRRRRAGSATRSA